MKMKKPKGGPFLIFPPKKSQKVHSCSLGLGGNHEAGEWGRREGGRGEESKTTKMESIAYQRPASRGDEDLFLHKLKRRPYSLFDTFVRLCIA